jgi:hypothetical protein
LQEFACKLLNSRNHRQIDLASFADPINGKISHSEAAREWSLRRAAYENRLRFNKKFISRRLKILITNQQ